MTPKLGDVSVHECFGHRSGGKSIAWNSMGTKVASSSSDRTAKIWSVVGEGKGREVANLCGHTASVEQILWSSEDVIVTSSLDRTLRIWDARLASLSTSSADPVTSSSTSSHSSSSCVARIPLPSAPINIDLHPNYAALAVLMEQRERNQECNYDLRIYDIRKTNLAAYRKPISNTNVAPSRKSDGATVSATMASQQLMQTYLSILPKTSNDKQYEILNQGRFSPFGYHYLAASRNSQDGLGKLHIMDCSDMTLQRSQHRDDCNENKFFHTLVAHTNSTSCFCFSSCGGFMATGGSDAIVGIWEINELTCVRTVDRLVRPVQSLAFSHDSKILASNSIDDSRIDIADVETGEKIGDLDSMSRYGAIEMEWNPKGYALALACYFPENKGSGSYGRHSVAITVIKCSISNT
jgi:WD40 repeat protein